MSRLIAFGLSIVLTLFGLTAEGGTCTLLKVPDADFEYFSHWRELFNEGERLEKTSEGKVYNGRMLKAHNAFYNRVFANCEAEAKKSGEVLFFFVAVVSKTGVIEQVLTMPPRKEYQCFVNGIVGQSYPPPPTDHYPVSFLAAFDDPTGTQVEDCMRKLLVLCTINISLLTTAWNRRGETVHRFLLLLWPRGSRGPLERIIYEDL